ncbi:MAG TPA: MoxR family ATPase [Halanaerobiales bacterium]|nr:MoxR family ATPase [Halanaerobiales bacterium]
MIDLEKEMIDDKQQMINELKKEIKKVIVGQDKVIENILIAIFSDGNVLLEGVPGLGKTKLVQSLGKIFDLDYSRIQFTPDLMPADIIGTNILIEGEKNNRFFEFREGPLFAQLILADEINRATPKTQSALLEAMQEKRITAGGKTRNLKRPFFVLATQNPLEMEGTYPLPEAQVDRFFFKIKVDYPSEEELIEIVEMTTLGEENELNKIIDSKNLLELQKLIKKMPCSKEVIKYAVNFVLSTQPGRKNNRLPDSVKKYLRYGSSPRGAQTLILAAKARAFLYGRYNVSIKDINNVSKAALRHRLLLNFEGEAAEIKTDDIIDNVINFLNE